MMKHLGIRITALVLAGYIGLYGGKIALFRDGKKEPDQVFPYSAESLPPQARSALEKGIPFEDLKALTGLLESYLS